jgi:hypothetical protein
MKKILFSLLVSTSLYAAAQNLNSGLVAHYEFDRNATDATQNNNHLNGSLNSYIPFFQMDSAYYFNGINRLVQANNFNNTGFTSTSISIWIKPELGATTYGGILQGAYCGFTMYIENATGHVGAFFSANFSTTLVSNVNVLDSNWHHIVALNTGTETRIYIDGILNASRPQALVTSGGSASQKYVYLGATNLSLNYYRGGVNDLRIYNRVLTQAEITALATFPTATALSKANREEVTVNIYPNPTNGQITIDTDESLYNSNFIVKNMLGQNISQGIINSANQMIEIGGPKGIYFVELISTDNKRIIKKVIKN